MNVEVYIFYALGGLTLLSALGILLTRNIIHAAFLLVVTFFAVAGIYVLANASFVGVTQLLIYVGGILILMIFGIMLTNKLNGKAVITDNHNQFAGILIGGVFFTLLSYIILDANFSSIEQGQVQMSNIIKYIGINMMTTYLIPFEIAAVLLLIALIGAAVLSEKRKQEKS